MDSDRIGPSFAVDHWARGSRRRPRRRSKYLFTRRSRGPLAESPAEAVSSAIGNRGCIHVQSWRIVDDRTAARRQLRGTRATGGIPAAPHTGVPAGSLRWHADRGASDTGAAGLGRRTARRAARVSGWPLRGLGVSVEDIQRHAHQRTDAGLSGPDRRQYAGRDGRGDAVGDDDHLFACEFHDTADHARATARGGRHWRDRSISDRRRAADDRDVQLRSGDAADVAGAVGRYRVSAMGRGRRGLRLLHPAPELSRTYGGARAADSRTGDPAALSGAGEILAAAVRAAFRSRTRRPSVLSRC